MPSPIRRRFLLATAGLAAAPLFAGCLVDDADGDAETDGDDDAEGGDLSYPKPDADADVPDEREVPARGDPIDVQGDPNELPDWHCADAAFDAVSEAVVDRFGEYPDGIRQVPRRRDGQEEPADPVVVLEVVWQVDDSGEVVSRPGATFEAVADRVPSTVTADLTHEGDDLGCSVDVLVSLVVEDVD